MRKAIAVIGEGITEKYYIESLKGLSPFTVLPRELGRKASSLRELENAIKKAIQVGYDEVYCLIDMDGKREGKNRATYLNLKGKYNNKTLGSKKNDIQCRVVFIETERCTELWFLYHFAKDAVTREFTSYKEVEQELRKHRPSYEKTKKYFRTVANLHYELTQKRAPVGSLKQAVLNAKNSMRTKEKDGRDYGYSEMHLLIDALGITYE